MQNPKVFLYACFLVLISLVHLSDGQGVSWAIPTSLPYLNPGDSYYQFFGSFTDANINLVNVFVDGVYYGYNYDVGQCLQNCAGLFGGDVPLSPLQFAAISNGGLCQCGASLAPPFGTDHVRQFDNVAATGAGSACNINPNEYCGAPGYTLVYSLRSANLFPGSISNPWINPGNGQWGYAGTFSDPEANSVFQIRSDDSSDPIVLRNFVDVATCLDFCSLNGRNLADAPTAGTSTTWQYAGLINGGGCVCGNGLEVGATLVANSLASSPCNENAFEFCGGPQYMQVYSNRAYPAAATSSTSVLGTSTLRSTIATTASSTRGISTSLVPTTTRASTLQSTGISTRITTSASSRILTSTTSVNSTRITTSASSRILTSTTPGISTRITTSASSRILTSTILGISTPITTSASSRILTSTTLGISTPITTSASSRILTSTTLGISSPITTSASSSILTSTTLGISSPITTSASSSILTSTTLGISSPITTSASSSILTSTTPALSTSTTISIWSPPTAFPAFNPGNNIYELDGTYSDPSQTLGSARIVLGANFDVDQCLYECLNYAEASETINPAPYALLSATGICTCASAIPASDGVTGIKQLDNVAATISGPCLINPYEYCGSAGFTLVYRVRTTFLTSGSISTPYIVPGNGQWSYDGLYSDPLRISPFVTRQDGLATTLVVRTQVDIGSCLASCGLNGHLLGDVYGQSTDFQYAGITSGGACICGSGLQPSAQRVADSLATVPCTGNSYELCGGVAQMQVYSNRAYAAILSSRISTIPASSSSASVTGNLDSRPDAVEFIKHTTAQRHIYSQYDPLYEWWQLLF
ncbi:uncharacterized protein L3040_008176 [Drepanopeziza brunnea f. sp. 'multigermtubi']|uniref:uncharacterized protein n=1 Tax=Drepanopeziza brunnea f. sp. 'multigermtubi' TaxID=698441 RepID=UPI002382F183|nr:hypothetical protein L3040_008176 [Drepanopeziza brunnea f. sp. 'multigermtubi']